MATGLFYSLLRDSPVGVFINHLSCNKLLKPHTLREDYVVSDKYLRFQQEDIPTATQSLASFKDEGSSNLSSTTATETLPDTSAQSIIVDWDGDNDPENPKNWPLAKKVIVVVLTSMLATSGYMAAAIFTPANEQMKSQFGTSNVKLMLGITLFVWGYGLSPLFVSAMSESPMFGGRRWILLVSQFLFVVLQIPTALSNDVASFAVLRFLSGLFVGPPLSISAGIVTDMFDFPNASYVIAGWSFGVVMGPYLGPLIGAALTHANSWRWAFWFLLIQAGATLVVLLLGLPETSAKAILMMKARRLRKRTGNNNIIAAGDLELKDVSVGGEFLKAAWMPIKMCLQEPILDLVNLHISLLYAVIYLFFEAFPIVFVGLYKFTVVEMGVAFTALSVPVAISVIVYAFYLDRNLVKPIKAGIPKLPEISFGYPALLGSILVPIGLFIFGWSATPSAHWMGPIMGACIMASGTFFLFQTYISYIGTLYPTMFATAVASNTVLRSFIGGAFPLFGTVFYNHTAITKWPVGWGSSILGFAAMAMIGLPIYFIVRGPQLREKAYQRWSIA